MCTGQCKQSTRLLTNRLRSKWGTFIRHLFYYEAWPSLRNATANHNRGLGRPSEEALSCRFTVVRDVYHRMSWSSGKTWDPGLKSRLGDRTSSMRYFVVFLSPFRKMLICTLKSGHDRVLPSIFFPINYSLVTQFDAIQSESLKNGRHIWPSSLDLAKLFGSACPNFRRHFFSCAWIFSAEKWGLVKSLLISLLCIIVICYCYYKIITRRERENKTADSILGILFRQPINSYLFWLV
jgi:hypothetical protein